MAAQQIDAAHEFLKSYAVKVARKHTVDLSLGIDNRDILHGMRHAKRALHGVAKIEPHRHNG